MTTDTNINAENHPCRYKVLMVHGVCDTAVIRPSVAKVEGIGGDVSYQTFSGKYERFEDADRQAKNIEKVFREYGWKTKRLDKIIGTKKKLNFYVCYLPKDTHITSISAHHFDNLKSKERRKNVFRRPARLAL